MELLLSLLSLISSSGGIFAWLGAAVIGALGLFLAGRRSGTKAAETKRAAEQLAAANDRLEMNREATEAEKAAAALSDKAARERAMEWARK